MITRESTNPTGSASGELALVVDTIAQEADGVVSVHLMSADGRELPTWTPGAHIDLLLDGHLERHYSLCGDPADRRRWRIAVLREAESRGGSEWLHTRLRAGDALRVRGPRNHFPLVDAGAYLFIAGGIGITPILPMVREIERRGHPWTLLYGGRRRSSMAFTGELESYGERVHLAPEDEQGLLDLKTWIGAPRPGTAIYSCGPERLLEAVEKQCTAWPESALHVERFRPRPGALEGESGSFEVVLARSGLSCTVATGETIIDALDRIGVDVPRSCGEGTCGTCLTGVLEGTPDHRDSFLMGRKRAENKSMCVCCSRSKSARIVLDL